jgi:hypothetical protein
LEVAAQAQFVTKPLDQEEATEVSQGIAIKRKLQCLQASAHFRREQNRNWGGVSISSLLVRLLTPAQKAVLNQQNQWIRCESSLKPCIFEDEW